MSAVLGLDGCKGGWVGVRLSGDAAPAAMFGRTVDSIVRAGNAVGRLDIVAIDIPIGLTESSSRRADALARGMLGARASSVFSTPLRASLEADDFAAATAIARQLTGKGLTQQAYALRQKILEVDDYLAVSPTPIIEIHPEVVFAQLNGAPLPWSKKTWAGHTRRRELLAREGVVLPDDIGDAGRHAAVGDVIDAAAAAWLGWQYVHGNATNLPDPPELVTHGGIAAIWICASPPGP